MSTRSSVFYCSTKNQSSIHLYHEGMNGTFRLEIEQDTQNEHSSINIDISKELKDAFIKAAIAYPNDPVEEANEPSGKD